MSDRAPLTRESGTGERWLSMLLLAPGQLISWGTLYYGLTFLARPIQEQTGWSLTQIFGVFSAGLLITALCPPVVGGLIVVTAAASSSP